MYGVQWCSSKQLGRLSEIHASYHQETYNFWRTNLCVQVYIRVPCSCQKIWYTNEWTNNGHLRIYKAEYMLYIKEPNIHISMDISELTITWLIIDLKSPKLHQSNPTSNLKVDLIEIDCIDQFAWRLNGPFESILECDQNPMWLGTNLARSSILCFWMYDSLLPKTKLYCRETSKTLTDWYTS